MNSESKNLPSFKNPPLLEVALSVQFDPIQSLQATQLGVLWSSEYREKYPHTEQHPPIAAAIERFDVLEQPKRELRLEFSNSETPRCWFLKDDKSELIQVQQDRLIHNWRKMQNAYPRYESIREEFSSDLGAFSNFIEHEKLGSVTPNQCEVIYINHIPVCDVWKDHSELNKIFPNWKTEESNSFFGTPENIRLTSQYILKDSDNKPLGRLYINLQPAFRAEDSVAIYILTMTVRGKPLSDDKDGVMSFLDYGREVIVNSFASVTSKEMHKVWGRIK